MADVTFFSLRTGNQESSQTLEIYLHSGVHFLIVDEIMLALKEA